MAELKAKNGRIAFPPAAIKRRPEALRTHGFRARASGPIPIVFATRVLPQNASNRLVFADYGRGFSRKRTRKHENWPHHFSAACRRQLENEQIADPKPLPALVNPDRGRAEARSLSRRSRSYAC